jgi:adenylyltransferase/sulfurtransferase
MKSSSVKKADIQLIDSKVFGQRVTVPRARKFPFEQYYSRQIALKEFGEKGQRKLLRSKVAVVGLGGLGTVSSLYLTLAGVGHMRLIDQDVVELANLHRQILYGPDDIGYPKAEISARRLAAANPFVVVEPVAENVNSVNVERLLSGVDCVVDGLDNMRTRYLINRACIRLGIPYVFGAAIGVEGNLSAFQVPDTPCLECLLPNVDDSCLETCESRGVIGAAPGIIGSMQAMETIKVLTGMGSTLKGKLMVCDFADMYFSTIDILKRPDCTACNSVGREVVAGDKVVWLCGRSTANVNPEKPLKMSLNEAFVTIKDVFKIRVKSQLAVIFDYNGFEITLFNGGRMIIKNVKSESTALRVYGEIRKRLDGRR